MSLLGTDTAGMTKLADRLEAKHLIERHPNPQDRRSVLITLTSDGQALAPQLAPVFGRVTRQLFNGFSSGEVSALAAALNACAATSRLPSNGRVGYCSCPNACLEAVPGVALCVVSRLLPEPGKAGLAMGGRRGFG